MIAIDTNILIWGLDQKCSPGLEPMLDLAKQFFDHVTKQGVAVAIPAQVLAEFLVRNTDEEREDAMTKLSESFPIAPLDLAAAAIAAKISSERDHYREVRDTFGVKRNCFKADINVLASAIGYGATTLVTGNSSRWSSSRLTGRGRKPTAWGGIRSLLLHVDRHKYQAAAASHAVAACIGCS